jgi:hypothetical protein
MNYYFLFTFMNFWNKLKFELEVLFSDFTNSSQICFVFMNKC